MVMPLWQLFGGEIVSCIMRPVRGAQSSQMVCKMRLGAAATALHRIEARIDQCNFKPLEAVVTCSITLCSYCKSECISLGVCVVCNFT